MSAGARAVTEKGAGDCANRRLEGVPRPEREVQQVDDRPRRPAAIASAPTDWPRCQSLSSHRHWRSHGGRVRRSGACCGPSTVRPHETLRHYRPAPQATRSCGFRPWGLTGRPSMPDGERARRPRRPSCTRRTSPDHHGTGAIGRLSAIRTSLGRPEQLRPQVPAERSTRPGWTAEALFASVLWRWPEHPSSR